MSICIELCCVDVCFETLNGFFTKCLSSQAAMGLKDRSSEVKHGLPGHLLGPVPLQTGLESKVSPSHQALLQHLLQKEQMRQQKMLSSGRITLLDMKYYILWLCVTYSCNLINLKFALLYAKAKVPCHPTLSPLWP